MVKTEVIFIYGFESQSEKYIFYTENNGKVLIYELIFTVLHLDEKTGLGGLSV